MSTLLGYSDGKAQFLDNSVFFILFKGDSIAGKKIYMKVNE